MTGLEVRSLLNLEITDPDIFKTPQYDNGFVRDSGNGLFYQGCLSGNENDTTDQPPAPVNQSKSSADDIFKTVHGFLALQRLLDGVVDVEINDLDDSVYLKNSDFLEQYDTILAGCELCSRLEDQRTAHYMNESSILYQQGTSVEDIFAVKYCVIHAN